MDKLIPIIRTFDKYKIQRIDILNNPDSTSRSTQLYKQILKGKITDDDEAAQFLFGKDANKKTGKYRTFKTDFKKRVLNTLLFINTAHEDFDEYQQFFYEANREWMTIRALNRQGIVEPAHSMAKALVESVIKYEYTELAVVILETIKITEPIYGDKQSYQYYHELSEYQTAVWLAEQKARHYANLLRLETIRTKDYKPHLQATIQSYLDELNPLMDKYSSTGLHIQGRIVELGYHSCVNDHHSLVETSERALVFFRSKPFLSKMAISGFLHQKTASLSLLKRFEEANFAIDETIALRTKGSHNWFKANQSKVILYFKMHRFSEGYALYKDIIAMPEFKQIIMGVHREHWLLFNAYFHLLYQFGKAPDLPLKEAHADFSFLKLVEEMPTLATDKRGMNLTLVVLDICFMMAQNQRAALIDSVESFQKYFSRNTKKEDPNYRFHQFGNMLLEIPKSGFRRALIEQNTAHLFKDLESVTFDSSDASYYMEVMPLEDLWTIVLENFEQMK
jgi:hypothetical protein